MTTTNEKQCQDCPQRVGCMRPATVYETFPRPGAFSREWHASWRQVGRELAAWFGGRDAD